VKDWLGVNSQCRLSRPSGRGSENRTVALFIGSNLFCLVLILSLHVAI
jgi:hypothetical protein